MNLARRFVLQRATRFLDGHRVPEPLADAEVLLAHVLVLPRLQIHFDAHEPISLLQQRAYQDCLRRRARGEPVQYITGSQEFHSLAFEVNPHVLIPRPESELLVDQGVRWARHWASQNRALDIRCLDVGTGSGNLGISLLRELPKASVCAIDSSPAALSVARRNARRLGVEDRWHGLCGDLVEPFRCESPCFAVCVANLPYVTDAEWQQLPEHIRDYEPEAALRGGTDGLDVVRRLILAAPQVLARQGTLLLEVGWRQAEAVERLMRQTARFGATGRYPDFAGVERVVWGRTSQPLGA